MSRLALNGSFFFILRRSIFVLSALQMTEGFLVFIAVAIFIISSFLYLLYFTIAKPHTSDVSNYSEVINELFVLLIGYFAYILIDNSAPRIQIIALG